MGRICTLITKMVSRSPKRGRLTVPPPPYVGRAWIGQAITNPPLPVGPDWIGKRCEDAARRAFGTDD